MHKHPKRLCHWISKKRPESSLILFTLMTMIAIFPGSLPLAAVNVPVAEGRRHVTIQKPTVEGHDAAQVVGDAKTGFLVLYPSKPTGAADQSFTVEVIALLPQGMSEEDKKKVSARMIDEEGVIIVGGAPRAEGQTLKIELKVASPLSHGRLALTFDDKATDHPACNVNLLPVELKVDANRDGEITGADQTTPETPYRFWINNDDDRQSNSNKDHPWTDIPNWASPGIDSRRDLEDFTRLHIDFGNLYELLEGSDYQIGIRWLNVSEGSPSITLYDQSGEHLDYLRNVEAANQQLSESPIGNVFTFSDGSSSTLMLPRPFYWPFDIPESSARNVARKYLYEGNHEGKGELGFVIFIDGNEVAEVGGLHLHLTDVRRMFEKVKTTPVQIDDPGHYRGGSMLPDLDMDWEQDPWDYPFEEAWDEDLDDKRYVVFVHGWRMTYNGSRSFAITMFKRLWWENFKGRYVAFRWPTYASQQDHLGFVELEGQVEQALQSYLSKYNHSEYRAWRSGISLKKYVESLPSDYSKNLVAHSMGNIVTSSALREGLDVRNYALLQAAVPATCYDGRSVLYQEPSSKPTDVGDITVDVPLWDFTTVGDDSVESVRSLGYKEQFKTVSGNLVNFYLPDDEATSFAWELNNSHWKPVVQVDQGPFEFPYQYFYVPTPQNGATTKLFVTPPVRILSDSHEVMAMADRSKTKAVGAEGRTDGSINIGRSIDLDAEYGFGKEHSAEFEREIQRLGTFYQTLKGELER